MSAYSSCWILWDFLCTTPFLIRSFLSVSQVVFIFISSLSSVQTIYFFYRTKILFSLFRSLNLYRQVPIYRALQALKPCWRGGGVREGEGWKGWERGRGGRGGGEGSTPVWRATNSSDQPFSHPAERLWGSSHHATACRLFRYRWSGVPVGHFL